MPAKRIRGRHLQQLRSVFLRQHPLCVRCQAQGRVTAAAELDHRVALRNGGGNEWENLQGLCVACHREKTREDLGRKVIGCDVNGNPLAASHHWNA